jgi:hypothetical protein
MILSIRLHDPAFAARLINGQLRGAFGALSEVHDLAAQLTVTCLLADVPNDL